MRTKLLKPSKVADAIEEDPEGAAGHRVPVIDKMMKIIETIEAADSGGESIGQVVARTGIPRSTVYRVLNTLASHGLLVRSSSGSYALGFRLLSLAAGVNTALSREDLIALARPELSRLADQTQETCKLSLLEDGKARAVVVVQSPNAMGPSSREGSLFDLHAGAASKLLLASGGDALFDEVVASTLTQHTSRTIVDRTLLAEELARIRETGLSYDHGEWNPNVHAVAAPLIDHAGQVVAAVSVTFFADDDTVAVAQRIVQPLRAASARLSLSLGGQAPRP